MASQANPTPSPSAQRFLRIFFSLARRTPWALPIIKPLGVWGAVHCSPPLRRAVSANARRILGPQLSETECLAFAERVCGHFYEFVADIGRSSSISATELRNRIESIQGRDDYLALRKQGGGAIIATAHMGSFEIGLASLAEVESHIHVVFKRDALDGFESIRRSLRGKLSIAEAAVDDGWATWVRLRDALAQNHVVVMQADRVMPGQKGQTVPLLGGHLRLPLGPLKLAQITGSPIVPIFTTRAPSGKCRIFVETPILVDPDAALVSGVHPAAEHRAGDRKVCRRLPGSVARPGTGICGRFSVLRSRLEQFSGRWRGLKSVGRRLVSN